MNAEIISVGTELLLGHTINTDASYVARELSTIGVNLLFAGTVGDNVPRLKETLESALQRSDLVITTGGLGPTGDDLTKETIAETAGKKLVLHQESMDRIIRYFKGRTVGETQEKQAMLPEGCTVFPNDGYDENHREHLRPDARPAFRTDSHAEKLCNSLPDKE